MIPGHRRSLCPLCRPKAANSSADGTSRCSQSLPSCTIPGQRDFTFSHRQRLDCRLLSASIRGATPMSVAFRIAITAACLSVLSLGGAQAANITGEDWGTTQSGEKASLFTLKGAHGLEARITNYGGRIVGLMVPNKQGSKTDVQLGFDDFASYEKDGFYGAMVGRYVGRVSHGGSFPLNGKTWQLQKTDPAAPFVIHGGTAEFPAQALEGADARWAWSPSLTAHPGQSRWRWRLSGRADHHRHLHRHPKQRAQAGLSRNLRPADGRQPHQPCLFRAAGRRQWRRLGPDDAGLCRPLHPR